MKKSLAVAFTDWAERYIPDAFVFAMLATLVIIAGAMMSDAAPPEKILTLWGDGFWALLSFSMQMCLVVITGHAVATTPPVHRMIVRLAQWPNNPRMAVALVAFLSMVSSWFNWGFGLMFGAMLAMEIARRRTDTDYRALAASSMLGLGSVWAQGLSGSAALQMATATALPASLRAVVSDHGRLGDGIIPLSETIFLWQSFASVIVEIIVVTALMYWIAPTGAAVRNAQALGIALPPSPLHNDVKISPKGFNEVLEHSPILGQTVACLMLAYVAIRLLTAASLVQAISLDALNFCFLGVALLLHRTPARLMRAVREATPAAWGIILQFPFYAGMAAVIAQTHINERIAHFFVGLSNRATFPALIAAYSTVLGIFVPSGGSKWIIEAPYVMQAAIEHQVHLGWMVAVYDLGEALANLIQPFWMLPILAMYGLRARDVMGYTMLVFVVLMPVVLILVSVLAL